MKKVFLLTMGLVLGFSAFAQKPVVKDEVRNQNVTVAKSAQARMLDGTESAAVTFTMPQNMMANAPRTGFEDFVEFETMVTNYDLQSNSALGNRIAVWPDGTASFGATWDHTNSTAYSMRGTGYNYYDGEDIGEQPSERQEPVKSGWPSLAACGNGEVLASHATGVNLYYRPTKGEGEWTLVYNWGDDYGSPTWPRVVVSGPNNEYIHLVMCKQINIGTSSDPIYDNHVYYSRVTRNGNDVTAWDVTELVDFPGVDNTNDGDYRNQLSADDYVMAANGNNVAVMFSAYTTEVFYMISHDNGETWERQIIAPFPIADENGNCLHAIDFDDYPEGMIDTIITSDASHSIAIDNNGVVHAAFGLFRWKSTDADHYTYWPLYSYGIVYWNSEYVNEQGGHEIPMYGSFSGDVNHPEWALSHLGWSLYDERIMELAAADNEEHLHFFGVVDENGNGQLDFENTTGASWHYRSYGWATLPGVSVDENGNLAIIYNACSETRINDDTQHHLRSGYVTLRDSQGTWFDDYVWLTGEYEDPNYFIHSIDEVYSTTASPRAYNGEFWFYYSADPNQGLYLDVSETYPQSNMAVLTENTIWAIKVVPQMPGWDGVENEVVNPMTTTRVYPNPATDMMNIEINASYDADAVISVYNIMGQNVMDMNVRVHTGINNTSVNASELSSGVYFVTVSSNGFSKTTKVVVK